VARVLLGFVLLGFALLVVMSVSAGLCRQMEHNPNPVTAGVLQVESLHGLVGTAGEINPDESLSSGPAHRSCGCQPVSQADAVIPEQRNFPVNDAAVPSVGAGSNDGSYVPPEWFDPARERPVHLRPSLTSLSISRT
jgi:hypothetical protein